MRADADPKQRLPQQQKRTPKSTHHRQPANEPRLTTSDDTASGLTNNRASEEVNQPTLNPAAVPFTWNAPEVACTEPPEFYAGAGEDQTIASTESESLITVSDTPEHGADDSSEEHPHSYSQSQKHPPRADQPDNDILQECSSTQVLENLRCSAWTLEWLLSRVIRSRLSGSCLCRCLWHRG